VRNASLLPVRLQLEYELVFVLPFDTVFLEQSYNSDTKCLYSFFNAMNTLLLLNSRLYPLRFFCIAIAIVCITHLAIPMRSGAQPAATATNTPLEDTLKSSARIGAEMQVQSGNIERFMLRVNASGDLRNSSFALMSSLSYSLHQIFGQQLDNDWFGFVDVRAFPTSTFFPVAFATFETSNLRFLDSRVQGGVGGGINLVRSPAVNLSLSAALTYDQTRFRIANSYEGWRYSFHLYGNYALFDGKMILTHNFFSQPTALFTSNYRHRLIALLLIPITRNLSISSTLDYSYESVVDETRKPTNIFHAIGVTWSF